MRISDWSSDVCSSDLNPTEALGGLACLAPAHGFGPRESADDGRNDFRNHFGRRAARLFNDGEEDAVALVVLTFNELIAGQASGAQESFKRLSRCVSAWTFPLLSDRFRQIGRASCRERVCRSV